MITYFFTISKPVILAVFCFAAVTTASTAAKITNEILSNTVIGCTGNGDTLWMVTIDDQYRCGLNYTINKGQSWWGYRLDTFIVSLAFGNRFVLVALDSSGYSRPNFLWRFNHDNFSYSRFAIGWPSKSANDTAIHYYIRDIAVGPGTFWMACTDGGLVCWEPKTEKADVYYPGINRRFSPDSIGKIIANTDRQQKSLRVMAVDIEKRRADSLVIWVVTAERIWKFFPQKTEWDSSDGTLGSSALGEVTFLDVYIGEFDSTSIALCRAQINRSGGDTDTLFFSLDNKTKTWSAVFESPPAALTFGSDRSVYIVRDLNRVEKYSIDSLGGPPLLSEEHFRMRAPDQIGWPEAIYDVLFLSDKADSGALYLATNNGLLMGEGELIAEKKLTAFLHLKRAPTVKAGLKESYAYPSILTADQPKATFAYNLSEDAAVTIQIYDWNMDLVKTIIKKQQRFSGKNRPSGIGRSTDERYDYWDGTNQLGRKVAVGIYYYKITSDKGERSFGKIIVAK